MVRTRSVVIVAGLLLLVGFFSVTHLWFFQTAGSTPATATVALSGEVSTFSGAAVVEGSAFDRVGFVAKLREAVESRVGSFVAELPTETTPEVAVSLEEDREQLAEGETEQPGVVIKWCDATVLESQFSAKWPQSGVTVVTREGARIVELRPTATESIGTSSVSTQTLFKFALMPARLAEPACLTHSYIGVTPDGRLIHNNDVVLYQSYGAQDLIGYAFDGNPIYGISNNEVTDECGGSNTSGYQYHLSANRGFILGCFVSEPQQTLVIG